MRKGPKRRSSMNMDMDNVTPSESAFWARNMHRLASAAGSVTSIISETVVLIAARVRLKGQGSGRHQQCSFSQACPGAPRRTACLGGWISTWKCRRAVDGLSVHYLARV